MVELRLHRTREEIEKDIEAQGFEMIYHWRDDQIWSNKKQDILIWISWVNYTIIEYKKTNQMNL